MMQEYGPGVNVYDNKRIRVDTSLYIPFSNKKQRTENYLDYAPALGAADHTARDFVHKPALYGTILQGTIEYSLSSVLQTFLRNLNTSGDDYSLTLDDDVTITFPKNFPFTTHYYANPANFLAYFTLAFDKSFFSTVPVASSVFPKVNIKFKTGDKAATLSSVQQAEFTITSQMFFRQVTCVLFKKVLSINLTCCACVPSTPSEYVAWQSGIYKNCYNPTCTTWLQNNPNLYDSVFMGPCDSNASTSTAIAIAYVRSAASRGNNINVDIKQFLETAPQHMQ